jgi:hypothetical protein
MKKNQAITLTLLLACALFTSTQLHAQWSQNSTSIWGTNGALNVGIGTSTPTSARLQFDNGLGNKISLFSNTVNVGFGFGISGNNLVAYIPNLAGQRFSIRTDNSNGVERFIVGNDGKVSTGSRVYLGVTGTEGGFSVVHFKNGTSTTGGVVRASLGNTDVGNAPMRIESSMLYVVNGATSSVNMTINNAGNVGIGTTNPTYKLSVNGTIQTKEVRVESGWADYVFAPDFTLRPLSEVESYIRQNQHLPDVTSAAEIQKDGLKVGQQMTEMMQKIEELTLYVIDLKKENDVLKTKVLNLEQSQK